MPRLRRRGYTLIEIVVALVVFTTGALGLAGGSAIVAREITTNGVREESGRVVASRLETTESTCRVAESGSEVLGPITSVWTISRLDSFRVGVAGTVTYPGRRGIRTEAYSRMVRCQ